jgi:EAL and modified HD-GYP domain-containing signal transduction protein
MNMDDNGLKSSDWALARHPIFDTRQALWGYEIFCVSNRGGLGPSPEAEEPSLSSMASGSYVGLQQVSERGKRIVVGLNDRTLLSNLPYTLQSSLAALKVPERIGLHPDLMETLAKLKTEGYLLVVGDYSDQADLGPLYRLGDVLGISSSLGMEGLIRLAAAGRRYPVKLLATGVADRSFLGACATLGFDLFQGSYFKSPEDVPVRRISSNEIARLRLFQLIEQKDPDFFQVAEVIQSDASISFRLLALLNSAAFGFRQKIKSIRQAVTLLGWQKTRNWLRVALLNDLAHGLNSSELVYLSAQRGRFLERIGTAFDYWGFDPDSLQLLGLFSLLDVMLGLPMAETLQYLPLEDKLKSALKREDNNEYLPLLLLAEMLEDGRWEEAAALVRQLGLEEGPVKEAFQASVTWANQFGTMDLEAAES